jgi:hypothetical protein
MGIGIGIKTRQVAQALLVPARIAAHPPGDCVDDARDRLS